MTPEELESIVSNALRPDDWKVTRVAIGEFQGNPTTPEPATSAPPLVWLSLLDRALESHELVFSLQHDDPQWIKEEVRRQIAPAGTSIRNRIEVDGPVSGLLVGVNTGVINKNFYGGDTYHQVQIYVLSGAGRAAGVAGLIKENPAPYKFLLPYTARDLPIFKGRDSEITSVVRLIHEQRLLVIHGEAGVGKTSLLGAGVIPQLIEEGLFVIQMQDYAKPVDSIVQALQASREQLAIHLPENPTLPRLIDSVVAATKGTMVLVLDQFEVIFGASISAEQREALIAGLAESMRLIPSDLLRIVIVIRDEAQVRLWELHERLPDLLQGQFPLQPLTHEQAIIAIKEPLRVLKSQVNYYGDVVKNHLVPGLGDLGSEENPHFVHPPYLQIVCTWLYRKAIETDPPRVIDKEMLDELKGADGIVAGYMEETLEKLEDERRLASRVMALMAGPEVERWVLSSQLHEMSPDLSAAEIETVLETLVRTGLLVRRTSDRKYAFLSPTIADEILRLAGPEVQKRRRAEYELERVWLSWLARDAFASRDQLRYLATFGGHLNPRPVKSLLLLRSAVDRHEPANPWLNSLRSDEGRALIYQVEGLPLPDGAQPGSETTLTRAQSLLGLSGSPSSQSPQDGKGAFGPIAKNAAENRDASVRLTCALALDVMSDKSAMLERLEQSLAAGMKGLGLRSRRAELRGALADADPEIEEKNASLSIWDRMLIWKWRAARRVSRDRRRWIRLMVGGAVGAGLGVGLLRGILAAVVENLSDQRAFPFIQSSMYFWYAVIVGGSFALGMSLAEPLLGRTSDGDERQAPPSPFRIQSVLVPILMGALFFGAAHMVALVINGARWSTNRESIILGFIAGLGLGAAIYVQSHFRRRGVGWLLSLAIGSAAFGLVQVILTNFKQVLALGWGRAFYIPLENYFGRHWPDLGPSYAGWLDWLALIDAALLGLFLTAGIGLGLAQAKKSLHKRRPPNSL